MIQIPSPELVPELLQGALRLCQLAQVVRDLGFEPVEAKLGVGVGELLVEGAGFFEDGERLFGLAVIVQVPGAVMLCAELQAGLRLGVDERKGFLDVPYSTFRVDVSDGVRHIKK